MTKPRDRYPTVAQVDRDWTSLVTVANAALRERPHEWVIPAGLSASVGEGVHVRSVAADPTGNIAAGKEKVRKEIASAAEELAQAVNEARSALSRLHRVAEWLQPLKDAYEPSRRYPRTASRNDLAESTAAQGRRRMAGSGYGES